MRARVGLFAAALGALAPAHGARAADAHPLVGSWKMTLSDGICTEIYRLRTDGTSVTVSGAEVTEGAYEVSATPSDRGFYRLVERVGRGNGKPDCSGAVTMAGRERTFYVRRHRSGDKLLFCDNETLDTCVGPLERVADEQR